MSSIHTDTSDADLVRLAQAGTTEAFDELVRRYQDRVFRLCIKILRLEDDASEAMQDAFFMAYRGIGKFKAESTFSTWLYRVATNAALMKYRKRRAGHVSYEQSQSTNPDAEPMAIADWTTQPLQEVLNAETREILAREVEALPDNERTVFVLRDIMEQSNDDVARELGVTLSAVKSRLHRARMHLRDRMNRHFKDRAPRRESGR